MGKTDTDGRPQISTSFWIEGDDVDPEACTLKVGLAPTGTGIKGQYLPGRRWPVPKSFWHIAFEKERSNCAETGLKKLLDLLWPMRVNIRRHLQQLSAAAGFGSYVTIRDLAAEISLTAGTVSRLAYFERHYVIDIFDYRDSKSHLPPQANDVNTDSNPLSEITSAFVIEGSDFDAAEFSNATGFMLIDLAADTSTLARGRAANSTLILDLRHQRLGNIDDGVSELLDLLWDFKEPLVKYLTEKSLTGRLISSVSIHKFRPVYELTPESLRRLAELGLAYCLEVFDYRDEKVILRTEDLLPGWRPPPPRANLVVVFKEGVSPQDMDRFLGDAVLTEDGKGRRFFRAGIAALTKIGVANRAAYRVAFQETVTQQQRDDIMERASRSPVVYKILENVERGEVNLD